MTRSALLGFPSGWFAVARSSEVRRGERVTRRLCGEELVVFRGRSGRAAAFDAHCPHLGAHLGHAGVVEGDQLRCSFHGLCFDQAGACVDTGYGCKPRRGIRLRSRPLEERYGVVFVWFDAARGEPAWSLPDLAEEGWTAPIFERMVTPAHPLMTAENAVDTGHMKWVHGLGAVTALAPLRLEGPSLHVRYAVEYTLPLKSLFGTLRLEFNVEQRGLGCAVAAFHFPLLGLRTRQIVLATPVDHERTELLIGVTVARRSPGLAQRLLARLVAFVLFIAFRHEVRQDLAVWRQQRYLPRPALVRGDGPILEYRRWARQFFADDEARPPRHLPVLNAAASAPAR